MSVNQLAGHEMFSTPGLRQVLAALEAAGGEARIVGGAVRNALMGQPVSDIDIATTLLPQEVMAAGAAAGLGVHPTGIEHGTVTVVSGHNGFEVTTLRRDVATDGRHAEVEFSAEWKDDAARRDLTINALYADLSGQVHDPLGCLDDVETRTVRFVGDADARIEEDYLRVLRFFRFFAQYGHGAPDAVGLAACARHAGSLAKLSRERVGQETRKLICAPGAAMALAAMNEAGVSKAFFGVTGDAGTLERASVIDKAQDLAPDLPVRLAAGFDLAADELAGLLKLSNKERSALAALQSATLPTPALREAERKVVLYQTGVETFVRAVRLGWARADADSADTGWCGLLDLPNQWQVPVLPVTGADLVAAGMAEGPQIGSMLHQLEDWWIASGFTASREELLARAGQ